LRGAGTVNEIKVEKRRSSLQRHGEGSLNALLVYLLFNSRKTRPLQREGIYIFLNKKNIRLSRLSAGNGPSFPEASLKKKKTRSSSSFPSMLINYM
jgi:hypothetical protein